MNADDRISELLYLIKGENATRAQKEEYINLLYVEGYIGDEEFSEYKKKLDDPSKKIGEVLVGLGLAVMIGALISELFSKK
ncbi:MAG: hypothetical protein RLP15_11505 [Cryomorphaceae bacterium]